MTRLKHLLVDEAEEYASSWNGEKGASNALSTLVTRASNCIATALTGSDIEDRVAARFWECLEDLRRRYCVDRSDEEGIETDQTIARCCYHAFALLYNAIVNRRRFSHPSMGRHGLGLYTAARSVSHFAKAPMPCFRAWW